MSDALSLLDEALEIGEAELALLEQGREEDAWPLAEERGRLIDAAWERRETVDPDEIRSRLEDMRSLQDQLTDEAEGQREAVRRQLSRTKQENRRMSGYGDAVRPPKLYSRFINKQG